jgi:hypothetical protein
MHYLLFLLCLPALAQTLEGVVDLHVHSDPDSMPRSIDSWALARAYQARGVRAMVLKNHYQSTADLAFVLRKAVGGIQIFGGIALNRAVGGVNPEAVDRMAKTKGGYGRIVWMPTFDSENAVRSSGEKRPFVSVARDGKLLPEVEEVLNLVARHRLILATGHSSPPECMLLIRAAKQRAIPQVIVTHANLGPVTMNLEEMKAAAKEGAWIEFVGNALVGNTKVFDGAKYVKEMRAIGVERVILTSDLGQAGNPIHPDGLEEIFKLLRKEGLSAKDIGRISAQNPATILGLE